MSVLYFRNMSTTDRSPYITESKEFFEAISYTRLIQSSDYRYLLEIPCRRSYIPGRVYKKCYNDGTWTILVEVANKYHPKNVYMQDWLTRANQSIVYCTREDHERFRSQMEGTQPVTLADISDDDLNIYPPDHPPRKRSSSTPRSRRQWLDLDAPPAIPYSERRAVRVPVPQHPTPSQAQRISPYGFQIESQQEEYRTARVTDIPDMTVIPRDLDEHLIQKEYLKRRDEANRAATTTATRPLPFAVGSSALPSSQPETVASSSSAPVAESTVIGTTEDVAPEVMEQDWDMPEDQPTTSASTARRQLPRPFNVSPTLTEAMVQRLDDGPLKRQYSALKRKAQRARNEKRGNLVVLIDKHITWYLTELRKRQLGPYRPRAGAQTSTTTAGTSSSQVVATTEKAVTIREPPTAVTTQASVSSQPTGTSSQSSSYLSQIQLQHRLKTLSTSSPSLGPPVTVATAAAVSAAAGPTVTGASISISIPAMASTTTTADSLITTTGSTTTTAVTTAGVIGTNITSVAGTTLTSSSGSTRTLMSTSPSRPQRRRARAHSSSRGESQFQQSHDVDMPDVSVSILPLHENYDFVNTNTDIITNDNNPPIVPSRRFVPGQNTPPVIPDKAETSAERKYRWHLFTEDIYSDTSIISSNTSEIGSPSELKIYLGGGLSDWSEADSPESQQRYCKRHVMHRDKHPIITRGRYKRKKAIAKKRGYFGKVSNSPFHSPTFCKNGKSAPPRWWKASKRRQN